MEIRFNELNPTYTRFKDRPKDAILFLMKKKKGQCINAFYRKGIGYIDLIWGEVTDPVRHKGYGLSHIIEKHGKQIESMGYRIEDFIPIILEHGNLSKTKSGDEYILQSSEFRIVIERLYKGKSKNWILTAFNLKKARV